MTARDLLAALFEADRKLREAEATLLADGDADALTRAFGAAVDQALALDDQDEAAARLTRLADLCAQVQGQRNAETLLRILNHASPEVRLAAGEALRDFAYDRYAEVARAIEKATDAGLGAPALQEVPWILAEVGEPSAVPLIARCLKNPDPEVVASAIEALAELGDQSAVALLAPLARDKRIVQLEEGDAGYTTTLGQLAEEAITELEGG